MILNGKLTILVGKDQFRVESGPWSVLGADALTVPEGKYVPDFTAYISSEAARIIIFYPFVNKPMIQSQQSMKLNSELLSMTDENALTLPMIYEKGIELSPPINESKTDSIE